MHKTTYSPKYIKKRSTELRMLHTLCTGGQKLSTVAQRLNNPDCLSNRIVLHCSAVEALGRYILIKTKPSETDSATYEKYRMLKPTQIVNEVKALYPNSFLSDEVKRAIENFAAFNEIRNYLVHEFAFVRGGIAELLINEAASIITTFSEIIELKQF